MAALAQRRETATGRRSRIGGDGSRQTIAHRRDSGMAALMHQKETAIGNPSHIRRNGGRQALAHQRNQRNTPTWRTSRIGGTR